VFDVPRVGYDSSVLVSDLVCSESEHLVDDEGPLPRRRELVSILAVMNTSEDQVSDVELTRAHVALEIVS
jgi:hypothetical protein